MGHFQSEITTNNDLINAVINIIVKSKKKIVFLQKLDEMRSAKFVCLYVCTQKTKHHPRNVIFLVMFGLNLKEDRKTTVKIQIQIQTGFIFTTRKT